MNMLPHAKNLEVIRALTPSMRYQDGQPFSVWQEHARQKLAELLGLTAMQECDPLFHI